MKTIFNRHYNANIASIKEIARGVFEVSVRTENEFSFIAGQYIWLAIFDNDGTEIGRRAFSIAGRPYGTSGEFTIVFRSSQSLYKVALLQLQKEDKVLVVGPFGNSFQLPEDHTPLVFLAGGVGVAPFLSLIREAWAQGDSRQITLIYSDQDEQARVYTDELERLSKNNVLVKTVSKIAKKDIGNIEYKDKAKYYVSGPQGFVNYIASTLEGYNIPRNQITYEAIYPSGPDNEVIHNLFENGKPILPSVGFLAGVAQQFNLHAKLIEASTNHIIVTDLNGVIVFANKAAQNITGFSSEEIIGNTPRLWGGLMGKEFYKNLWKSKFSREAINTKVVNRKKSGEIYFAQAHIAPIISEQDVLVGWIATEEDITAVEKERQYNEEKNIELERSKKAMLNVLEDIEEEKKFSQEQKNKLSTILEVLPVGVIIAKPPKGEIELVNKRGVEILGKGIDSKANKKNYSKIYDILKEDGSLYPFQDLPLFLTLSTGKSASKNDLFIKKSDDETVVVSATATPVLNTKGNMNSAVVVFQDITKEKEIDKQKTEFVSLASHQLKTPIGSIQWNMEMMLDGDYGEISEKQKAVLQETYTMSIRMNDLVNALLNISRIEMGVFIIEPTPTDFVKLCDEVLIEMEPRRTKKGHELTKEFQENLPQVLADFKLLRIVFQNLLSNAIKYTQDKGKIKVLLKMDDENIIFSVANNGESIPQAEQSRIFTKMFRASNAQAQAPDGNGLGLYVVKQIVEKAGGKIWFSSKKGEDTIFTCSFPLSGMIAKSGTKQIT